MEHACRECEKWQKHFHYWNHMEPTQIQFSRTLTARFNQGLVVPRPIVSKFRDQLVSTVTLKDLRGITWTIGLERRDGELVFEQGWADFVSNHSLRQGDMLTFQYGGDSTFTVSTFDGESGCEKEALSPSSQPRETDVHVKCSRQGSSSSDESFRHSSPNANEPIEIETESEDYNPPRKKARKAESSSRVNVRSTHLSTSSKGKSVSKQMNSRDTGKRAINLDKTYGMYFVSKRRTVSRGEKEKAYQLACAFPSDKPSFIVSMLPSHVCKRFFLTIPQKFVREHIPKSTKEVVLRIPPGVKTWVGTYDGSRSYGVGLSGGWMNFVWDNNLEEGDVCVFQLTQLPPGNGNQEMAIALDVKIFRVVKKTTKLERFTRNQLLMKGEDEECSR